MDNNTIDTQEIQHTPSNDYYQFYYQENNSDNDSNNDESNYTRNSYQSPPISPRMAIFPDLHSLSTNLKRRALSIHATSKRDSCIDNINSDSFDDQSSTHFDIEENVISDISSTIEKEYDEQIDDSTNLTKSEEFSFDSDSSSILSFTSSGLSSTVTSSSISSNGNSDGSFLKRIRSDSTLSKSSGDNEIHITSEKSKKLSLIDILKKRNHTVEEPGSKTIDYRKRKRAESPSMFTMRRSKSLSSKDKDHSTSSENSFSESKKTSISNFDDNSNENTLVQPSPFVRTIFQFVESSFDDDYFSLDFNTKSSEDVTVFSTSSMKTFSGSKPFKGKSKPTHYSSMELTVAPEKSEPVFLSTGRRISENSEFLISAIAYLDRIRKAKTQQESYKRPKTRSRQRRCKSDPGLNYVKLRRFLDAYNELKSHGSSDLSYPKNAEKFNVNAITHQKEPLSLNRRFQLLSFSASDEILTCKTSDGILESHKNNVNTSQDSLRSKALRVTSSFASKKKTAKKIERDKQRESLSSEIERLNELNDDLMKFSASLRSNQNKKNDDSTKNSQEYNSGIETTDNDNKTSVIASKNDSLSHDIEMSTVKKLVESHSKMFSKYNSDQSFESDDVDGVNLFTLQTVDHDTRNYNSLNNKKFYSKNRVNDGGDLQTQLFFEKNNSFENSNERNTNTGGIDLIGNENNRGNSEHDFCLVKRLESESPCGENNNKKIRIRVGSLSDKLKRKHSSAKKYMTDDIEYWVGEFKPSISDSSIKKAEKIKEGSTLIGNFKKQFNSIRKKENKKSPDIVDDMNVLRRVSSRSNEDVNTAHKKTTLKQRSASFRLKREKQYDRDDHAKVSSIRSVFEPTPTSGENLKKKWRITSPKVKSAQKMVSFFQHVKKDKHSNSETSPIKNAKMKFLQYNSSPRLSPSVRLDGKSAVARKLNDSPYLPRRSPQVELMRRHFEKSESRQSNSSDYSSICSSNSNSMTSSENLNIDNEKLDSGNHSAESINEKHLLEERRKSMRKSMSLDCLTRSPPLFENSSKPYSSHEKMNKAETPTKEENGYVTPKDSSSTEAIVVDIPSYLVPQQTKRNDVKISQHDDDFNNNSTTAHKRKIVNAVNPLNFDETTNRNESPDSMNQSKGLIDPNKVSEEAFIKQLLFENEDLGLQLRPSSDTSDDSNSQDSLNDSFETLTTKDDDIFSDVPSIPQPLLLKSEEKSYNSYSSFSSYSSSPPSYSSYASTASYLYSDLYAPPKNDVSRRKNIEPPPVKPKPKILKKVSVDKETNQPSNVAMVTPFIKEDVKNKAHGEKNCANEQNYFVENTESYSKSVGLKPLTRKPSVIWAIIKKMEVALVLDIDSESKSECELKMESFEVRRVNNYEDVEELSVDTFIKHLKLLDKHMLDVSKQDIEYVQMGMHKVLIGNRKFDLSSVQVDDGYLRCNLCIQGMQSWSLASLAYDTLISKDYLEKYCGLILSQQYVVFFGPSGNSKSYLASKLSSFISFRVNSGKVTPRVYRNVTSKSWQKLLNDVPNLIQLKESTVILIDGFSQEFIESGIDISELSDQLADAKPPLYVICTLSQNPNRTVPMEWQIKFKWIWLPHNEEPVDGLLQRFLRRKFIQHGNPHLQKEFFRIVDWLNGVWKNINRIIEKFYSIEATLGPTLLYSCPTDILGAEEWFIDTWNYSIAPYFIQAIRQGIESRGQLPEWEDPLDIVLQSYPWVGEKAKKKMKLREIRLEDIGYRESSIYNFDSLAEQKRLMSFLKQLETLILDGGLGEIPSFKRLEYIESSL